jgi:hypothetical protein
METLIKETISFPAILIAYLPVLATVIGSLILMQTKIFRLFIRTLFISREERENGKTNDELQIIKETIAKLKEDQSSAVSEEFLGNLKHEINANASFRIQEIVDRHLKSLSEKGDPVVRHFEAEIRESVEEILKKAPVAEQVNESIRFADSERRRKNGQTLDELIARQLNSANNTRAAMMNLFVLFNLTLLGVFAFLPERFSDRSSITILGVYVSLSAFIIYIYRASNARSGSLLAVKEDDKKLSNLFEFLTAFKKSSTFSSNDVEIIRALLVNRIEREKGADHPYEVVLKGVTNSNVLLKGGKISPTNSK